MNIDRLLKEIVLCALILSALQINAQPPTDWHLTDPEKSGFNGIALDRLLQELQNTPPQQQIVVAIADTGIDPDHEDLQGSIWHNPDEIAGNALDDDGNGYVDDIHGWNFIGNPSGENVLYETLEVTRLYAKYHPRFKDATRSELSKKEKRLYDAYLEYKEVVEKEREKAEQLISEFESTEELIYRALDAFDKAFPGQKLDAEFLASFDPGENPQLQIAQQIFDQASQYGSTAATVGELKAEIRSSFDEAKSDPIKKRDYWYNPDFDSRTIVGDNYTDGSERYYGNNDTEGADASHGTHVAGIVGMRSDNDLGGRGIAPGVKLMSVRMLPDGDERDKDVANAIYYAVDNGASVINMSFGKGQSWDKKIVDKAVKYARKHDVLLVHAAGNGSMNNDVEHHYPIRTFEKPGLFGRKSADNWISVGALHWEPGENAVAFFSHYGKKTVDLFAPGVMIYSTAPGDQYMTASGTSSAAPVVAGVAALLRSYFPALTAQQIREILVESASPIQGKVSKPGTSDLVDPSEISISGGMVNAYRAYRLAEQTKGKKKVRKSKTEQRA